MARLPQGVWILLALAAIALPAVAEVNDYNVTFDILDESRVTQHIDFTLASPAPGPRELTLPLSTAEGLTVTVDGTPATPHADPGSAQVNLTLPTGARRVSVAFTTTDLVFSRSEELLFTSLLATPADARRVQATVNLPPGYVLLQPQLSPPGYEKSTDGRRVTLHWASLPPGTSLAFQLRYGNPNRTSLLVTFLATGAVGALALIMATAALHYRRRVSEARLEGFSDDEQKTISLLESKGTLYQEEITEQLRFSKAKTTRIIQKLESKGLLTKERIGRSNKLTWKK